jgi:uncharacterized protein (TIGR02145 family)
MKISKVFLSKKGFIFILMFFLFLGQVPKVFSLQNINQSILSDLILNDKKSIGTKQIIVDSLRLVNGSIPYKNVKIGTQIWMTQNLNLSVFRNGDSIKEAKTYIEWKKACKEGKPVWCYYKNDTINGNKYGKLYNWYAINDSRGIAPKGWRVPNYSDFETLVNTIQIDSISENRMDEYNSSKTSGFQLKSKYGWEKFKNQDGNGSDKFGFNTLPGGYVWLSYEKNKKGVFVEGIDFVGIGEETYFWAKDTEFFNFHLSNGWFYSGVSGFVQESATFCCKEYLGFYIRCINESDE